MSYGRSQFADIHVVKHIKGRLLKGAMIIINCVPFNTSLKGINLPPKGANSYNLPPKGANYFLSEHSVRVRDLS